MQINLQKNGWVEKDACNYMSKNIKCMHNKMNKAAIYEFVNNMTSFFIVSYYSINRNYKIL